MTVIDLIILSILAAMGVFLWRNLKHIKEPHYVGSLLLIVGGIGLIGLFHLADLAVMQVLPRFIGADAARSVMTDLHLNVRWVVTLIAVPMIFFGFVGTIRQQAEMNRRYEASKAQIADSASRIESILDLAAESILTLNVSGDIIGVNQAGLTMFGLGAGFADEGLHIDDLLKVRSDTSGGGSILDELDHEGTPPEGEDVAREVQLARGDGIGRHKERGDFPVAFAMSGFALPNDYLYTVIVTDVSETRRAESALQMTQKMEALGRLAGGIAHDFNNLLAVILGSTELAASQLPKDSPVLEELEHVEHAGHRAANLTKQLMAFSRHKGMEPRAFDLGQMVAHLEATLQRTVGDRIRVEFRPGHGSNIVNADPSQMEQMLMNLVINARDSISGAGVISIKMESAYLDEAFAAEHPEISPGYFTVLSVSDTGSGMDQELQKYIFEPFFTTKGDSGGPTGLGLSTAHGIVQRAGGTITLESEPGKGSTFYVYLPISKEKPTERTESTMVHDVPGSETILLVEDRASVRRLVSTILTREGYECFAADSGISALEMFRQDPDKFDIVLSDVLMPGMGGIELARHVREIRADIPMLFMSGYADSKQIADQDVADNIELMHKPFTRKEILGKIRDALKTGS